MKETHTILNRPKEDPAVCGLLLLHKGEGLTSQTAVTKVKHLFGASKAGHTGTLDPMATGVLPILLGRAVKASDFLLCAEKHYTATLRLGLTTDTEDITGAILSTCDTLPLPEAVESAVAAFRGTIRQTPPMYSALKVGGSKLVDLARKGETVERTPREIQVFSLKCTPLSACDYRLDVHCSKGTYIRTLCADIGARLGCGGVMASLCRTEAAGFPLSAAYTLEALHAMTEEERRGCLIPISGIFPDLPSVSLPAFYERLAKNGLEIYQKKIGTSFPTGQKVRFEQTGECFALGEVREYPEGSAIKPIKQF